MTSLDECLAKLRPLIGDGDGDDHEAARDAMSDFLSGHPGRKERCAAMLALEGALMRETADLANASLAFAFTLIEGLDRQRLNLEEHA